MRLSAMVMTSMPPQRRIFGCDIHDVTSDMRRKAKTANFGIIYGISAFGLAERLDISRREAKELIDGYFAKFPA